MFIDYAHSTHLAALAYCARHVNLSRIVEYGCGYYSTPFLAGIAAESYVGLETEEEFFGLFDWVNSLEHSRLVFCPTDWAEAYGEHSRNATFAFVDSLTAEMRLHALALSVRNSVPVTLLHDAEKGEYSNVLSAFRFKRWFTQMKPHTVLLSNEVSL